MIVAGRFCEQYPASATKDFNILLIIERKSRNNYIAAAFLTADPT